MQNIIITFIAFFVLRLLSLSYSIRNEKRLLKSGAVQYGKVYSLLLTLAHIVYYFSALYEAYTSGTTFNYFSVCGVFIMGFASSGMEKEIRESPSLVFLVFFRM